MELLHVPTRGQTFLPWCICPAAKKKSTWLAEHTGIWTDIELDCSQPQICTSYALHKRYPILFWNIDLKFHVAINKKVVSIYRITRTSESQLCGGRKHRAIILIRFPNVKKDISHVCMYLCKLNILLILSGTHHNISVALVWYHDTIITYPAGGCNPRGGYKYNSHLLTSPPLCWSHRLVRGGGAINIIHTYWHHHPPLEFTPGKQVYHGITNK